MTDSTQELDDRQHIKFNILVPFLTAITIKRQKEKGNRIKDTETAYYDFAVDLILDWHNKQTNEAIHGFHGFVMETDIIRPEADQSFNYGRLHRAIDDYIAERKKLMEAK